jgi:hypothetical protein
MLAEIPSLARRWQNLAPGKSSPDTLSPATAALCIALLFIVPALHDRTRLTADSEKPSASPSRQSFHPELKKHMHR